MITIKDLNFKRVENGTIGPVFTCCQCSNKFKLSKGTYYADYQIFPDAHYTFAACSAECVIQFNAINIRLHVDKYINDRIAEAINVYNKNKPNG